MKYKYFDTTQPCTFIHVQRLPSHLISLPSEISSVITSPKWTELQPTSLPQFSHYISITLSTMHCSATNTPTSPSGFSSADIHSKASSLYILPTTQPLHPCLLHTSHIDFSLLPLHLLCLSKPMVQVTILQTSSSADSQPCHLTNTTQRLHTVCAAVGLRCSTSFPRHHVEAQPTVAYTTCRAAASVLSRRQELRRLHHSSLVATASWEVVADTTLEPQSFMPVTTLPIYQLCHSVTTQWRGPRHSVVTACTRACACNMVTHNNYLLIIVCMYRNFTQDGREKMYKEDQTEDGQKKYKQLKCEIQRLCRKSKSDYFNEQCAEIDKLEITHNPRFYTKIKEMILLLLLL